MPVLPAALREGVDNAEPSTFEAFDPGIYTAKMSKIEAGESTSSKNPMWKIEFDTILDMDGNRKPGKLFTNLVLIDSVQWKIAQFFNAFGVPSNTNTDNLLGLRIRLEVGQRIVEQGKRKGQLGNEIAAFLPPKEGDEGYEAVVKLQRSVGVKSAAPKKAAPKAAAKPVDDEAVIEDEGVDVPVEDDDSDIDF